MIKINVIECVGKTGRGKREKLRKYIIFGA
jgi:hypothetical protein